MITSQCWSSTASSDTQRIRNPACYSQEPWARIVVRSCLLRSIWSPGDQAVLIFSYLWNELFDKLILVFSLEVFTSVSTWSCRGPLRHLSFRFDSLQHSLTVWEHQKSASLYIRLHGLQDNCPVPSLGAQIILPVELSPAHFKPLGHQLQTSVFCTETDSAHHDDDNVNILFTNPELLPTGRPHNNFHPASIL